MDQAFTLLGLVSNLPLSKYAPDLVASLNCVQLITMPCSHLDLFLVASLGSGCDCLAAWMASVEWRLWSVGYFYLVDFLGEVARLQKYRLNLNHV